MGTAGALAGLPWQPAAAQQQPSVQPAGGDIVIGQSAHLSGPLAPTLKAVLRGQDMALEEANRKGGINGRRVRLVTLDDAYDPKKCAENVLALIDQHKAVALYGLASTANVAAVLPALAEKKVPLVGVYTGAPALRAKQHPYFFTTMASYRDEVVQMVRNLVTLQRGKLALVYQNNAFGQLMLPVVEEVAKEQGATLVAKHTLEVSGADALPAVQALAAARPDALIVMAFGPSIVPLVRAAKSQLGVPIYCIGIANSKSSLEALGDEARGLAFTQSIPYPFRQTTPLTRDYAAAMQRAQLPIDFDHFFGYLNTRVLLEALRRAGKTLSAQTLVTALEAMGKVDLGGYTVSFGPNNHHGSSFVDITIVGPGGRFIR
jgi:ABC-type branched-subunit amino acid transport system substrate-binding protein